MSFITREYKFESSKVMEPKSDQHTMAMRSLRKLVKPFCDCTLAEIQSQNAVNASIEDMRKDPAA
ncbi:GD14509 [Drosophila simulans]|uniref:GD14509 n=1 Tax=Drosophila simulans TaxID=7240 RepID=B4QKH2_DROSI|nr:GD14509 [Drosophila simulans]